MKKTFSLLSLLFFSLFSYAQLSDSTIKVLIVTAHPDDESGMSATVYKITHELNGLVDLAVVTNGEAGYKYSLLAEPFYNVKLTDEATGRKYLPTIRKKELMAAGSIIGISNFFFFDQQDNHYTLDVDTVMNQIWDVAAVKRRLATIIEKGKYDFVFCLLPTPETHGHHKGATIMALQTLNDMKTGKPIILAVSGSSKGDTTVTNFKVLDKFPLTAISSGTFSYTTDRTVSFGFKNQLNYKIIANWEIAEHKSQGSMQTFMGRGDYENFWYFDINGEAGRKKAEQLFERLSKSTPGGK